MGESVAKRFWKKVAVGGPDECWMWRGAKIRRGYGSFRYGANVIRAHRAAWMLTRGPIPPALYVCHRCDVPLCVNPGHLFLGTAKDNSMDMCAKGRGHRPQILLHALRDGFFLSRETRLAAEAGLASGENRAALSRRLGISRTHLYVIRKAMLNSGRAT